MAELWLVCEGGPNSVDAAVLEAIFNRVLGADIIIEPAGGGCSQLGAAAAFLQKHRGGIAAYVEDRDYRYRREQADASFGDGSNGFIWRRHSIENYLLVPSVIGHAFRRLEQKFEEQYRGQVPSWVAALPADAGQIAETLRKCSRVCAPEAACRRTVHSLWEDLSESAGRVQKREVGLPMDRQPHDLDGWREALRLEATRLHDAADRTSESIHLGVDAVVRRFDEIYAAWTAGDYVNNLQFLIDFSGKDLLRQFRYRLEEIGVRFSYKRLEKALTDSVADVYAADRAGFGSDDFLEIANGTRTLAGLPPLA